MIYEAKTLLTGYRIGLRTPHLYVGVPKQNINGGGCFVRHNRQMRSFSMEKCVKQETFNDKFRPGETYTLCYFLWKRVKKGPLKEEGQEVKEAVFEVLKDLNL